MERVPSLDRIRRVQSSIYTELSDEFIKTLDKMHELKFDFHGAGARDNLSYVLPVLQYLIATNNIEGAHEVLEDIMLIACGAQATKDDGKTDISASKV